MSFTSTNFILQAGIFIYLLSCGAVAELQSHRRYTLAGACACSESSPFVALVPNPTAVPCRLAKRGATHRADTRGAPVRSDRDRQRTRTTCQVTGHLSKSGSNSSANVSCWNDAALIPPVRQGKC